MATSRAVIVGKSEARAFVRRHVMDGRMPTLSETFRAARKLLDMGVDITATMAFLKECQAWQAENELQPDVAA